MIESIAVLARWPSVIARIGVALVAFIPGTGALHAQSDEVQSEATVQLRAMNLAEGRPAPSMLHVEELELQEAASVRLFRVSQRPTSHDVGVLVGFVRGEAIGLGGFASPKVEHLVTLLGGVKDSSSATLLARALATYLDPSGARRVVYPFAPKVRRDSVVDKWMAGDRRNWGGDSVWTKPDGGLLVLTTVLSRGAHSYQWAPYVYAFDFAKDGRLLAWWRNVGGEHFYFADGSVTD